MDLVDPFGRTVRDLRISVTDRCNFRCTYCMPEEGMQWLPREEILTFEEIERLARLCVERFGVDGIRLTGGEPTVRAHLPVLVEKLSHLRVPSDTRSPYAGRKPDLSITTNGATFRLLAHELRAAGLDRVNVSLDTLDAGPVRGDDPAGRAPPRAGRHRRRAGGRLLPGQGQRRRPAGGQRRRDRGAGRVRAGPRRAGALHRVHAPRRHRGLAGVGRRQPGRDRGRHRRRAPAGAGAGPWLRARPTAGATWTGGARWASSRPSPGRSAATATGSA